VVTAGPASVPGDLPAQPGCPSCGQPAAPRDSRCAACGADLAPLLVSDDVPRDHQELELGRLAGITDRGLRHDRNEDAMALGVAAAAAGPVRVLVVCDGVSSADRPDEASLAVARAAGRELLDAARAGSSLPEASARAAERAREAVDALAAGESPAATFVGAVLSGGTVTVCWLGDSRAYWLDAGGAASARLLTRDDSLAEEMVALGLLPEDEALSSPQAHVVTRWIGPDAGAMVPHVTEFDPPGPGVLLLCSDGLWNYAPDPGKLAALAMPGALADPRAAAATLVRFALDAGGADNITAALAPYPATTARPG
jgi:serine/threonine protein phosphatase PrpC